jgi:hypothetical protein
MPPGPEIDSAAVDSGEGPSDDVGPLGSGEEVTLRFPDLPRLELDELLAQLVSRAPEVMGTHGRPR